MKKVFCFIGISFFCMLLSSCSTNTEMGIATFILIVCGIFQIILFFKVWNMTDNVDDIKDLLEKHLGEKKKKERPKLQNSINDKKSENIEIHNRESENIMPCNIPLFSWVEEIETGEEYQVMEIYNNGSLLCVNVKHQDGKVLGTSEVEKM